MPWTGTGLGLSNHRIDSRKSPRNRFLGALGVTLEHVEHWRSGRLKLFRLVRTRSGGVLWGSCSPEVSRRASAAAAIQELEGLGGQFVKGVATDLAPATADHVFQYFPYKISGAGRTIASNIWRLITDTVRLLKPGGAAHFVTEDLATAQFLTEEAWTRGMRVVLTETAGGAAAPGAAGAGVPNFSQALKVWLVNIYHCLSEQFPEQ